MIIDETLIENGITTIILAGLIEKHKMDISRLNKLNRYYRGEHSILNRQKKSTGTANNKVVCNHAKYITDMTQSFLIGNPVTYEPSKEYDIEAIKNEYLEQDIASLDSELVKSISIYGRAYELVYADETSQARSVVLEPQNTFVVYSQRAGNKPIFGVYYYPTTDLDGQIKEIVCSVYDEFYIHTYKGTGDSGSNLMLVDSTQHYFLGVPIIEYCNNADKQGDFEQLISLIDAYNILQSDRINDKEQFVDSLLFLKNADLDSETAQKLKEEKILLGFDNADAKYLSEVLSEADLEVLKNSLKEDIHKFSLVPDLTDQSFGSNLSGVAIKYKLMGFENHVKSKERYLTKALKERFRLYNQYLTLKGAMSEVPAHRVDVLFKHNLPANELETAQMIGQLIGVVSNETLLSQLPFVSDTQEEIKIINSENELKMQQETNYNINSGDFYEDAK